MKLIKFIGKGIRGYMNHEISFREGVTFLIGVNGSGKTSVLKLISGITQTSYRILENIEFNFLELQIVNDGKEFTIQCVKDKETITVSLSRTGTVIANDTFHRIHKDDLGYIDKDDFDKYINDFRLLNVCVEIRKMYAPLFIGIDRKPDKDVYNYIPYSRYFNISSENPQRTDVDKSLIAIQHIVNETFSKNVVLQKKASDKLRTNVLKEALSLITSDENALMPNFGNIEIDNDKFEDSRDKFIQALNNAGIDESKKMADDFFVRQKHYIAIITGKTKVDRKEKDMALFKWIDSQSGMKAIDNIISHENVYEQTVSKINEQMTRFTDCVNLFFANTLKKIKINESNGHIVVHTPYTSRDGLSHTHTDNIMQLSSGEKQIVALIGMLIFTSSAHSGSLIIDEPELSLHLDWQEIFVDTILKAQPNFQFIMATHSPTIISSIDREEWCIDLSRKQNN